MIEAHHLFQLPSEQIDVVVHPQSVVHGLVTYRDGSVLAHLGTPDMRTPIAYALGWPGRTAAPTQRLDLAAVGRLTFEAPDPERFPALRLAREALTQGGGSPTVLNAANETAVHAFLDGRIGFLDIAATVEETLEAMPVGELDCLDDVYHIDREARAIADRACRAPRAQPSAGGSAHELSGTVSHGGLTHFLWIVFGFLVVLTVLVFVHEFGHYLIARRNGVRIEVFSIGFGPELFGWNDRAGTRWKFSAMPLGGYVKMFGDSDAQLGLPAADARRDDRGRARGLVPLQAARPARRDRRRRAAGEFRVRDRGAGRAVHDLRPAVHAGGGRPDPAGQRRRKAGMQVGDVVDSIDGRPIDRFEDVQQLVRLESRQSDDDRGVGATASR